MTLLESMTMRRILSWLPFVVFLWSGIAAEAQRDRTQDPARQRKAQMKMKREREKQRALEEDAVVLQLGVHRREHALLHARGRRDVDRF